MAAVARIVHRDLSPEEALAKLDEQLIHIMRLDEADPAAAWRARVKMIHDAAAALNARRFDAIRLRGEGTDLTVGLLPSSTWTGGAMDTVGGISPSSALCQRSSDSTPVMRPSARAMRGW